MLNGASILLTGATGLIGGEVARLLLNSHIGKLSCLVRRSESRDPGQRLAARLKSAHGSSAAGDARLQAVEGDVTRPRFGLSDRDFTRVTDSVDLIVHCASELSFMRDQLCQQTNVTGMKHLIDLARQCRREPLVVHMGTAASCGVVTHRCLSEEDGSDPENDHHNEYTRSKAVAERVLRESRLRCLIVRPSIVLSAGVNYRKFARAIVWFMPLLRHFEAVPVDPASRMDIVPVGFVAESLVKLLQRPKLRYDCYNLSAGPAHASLCSRISQFVDGFYGREQPLRLIPPREWTRECHRRYVVTPEQRRSFSGLRYYLPFMNMDVVYDNRRLREELGGGLPEIAPITAYMGNILQLITPEEALADS